VAALLAAEARPGDPLFAFSSPSLSAKLCLPLPGSVPVVTSGSLLQGARHIL
jgi:hypothetical protein